MTSYTPEQLKLVEAEVRRAAIEDRAPDPAAWGDGPPPAVAEERPRASGRDRLRRARGQGVPYTLPGDDSPVYIHPSSGTDAERIITWTDGARARARDGSPQALSPGEAVILPWANQAICVVRDGPDASAKRLWGLEDRAEIMASLSYEVLKEIVEISGRLGKGDEWVGEVARGFFGTILTCLQNVSGALSTCESCPPGLKEQVTAISSELRRCVALKKLSARPD